MRTRSSGSVVANNLQIRNLGAGGVSLLSNRSSTLDNVTLEGIGAEAVVVSPNNIWNFSNFDIISANKPYLLVQGGGTVSVPLTFGATGAYGLRRHFGVARPPTLPDQFKDGIWDPVGITVASSEADGFTNVPLLIATVPASFTGVLKLGLVLNPNPPDGTIVELVQTAAE